MLTFAEEYLLLAHDEMSGNFAQIPLPFLGAALAGGCLMDLALLGRVDSNPNHLILVDSQKTTEPILDLCLSWISQARESRSVKEWVKVLAHKGAPLRDLALDRLLSRGILELKNKRFLWVFRSRAYPLIDNREIIEVKHRITNVLFNDEIPDPRDCFLVVLAERSGLMSHLFRGEMSDYHNDRITQLIHLDLFAGAVNQALRQIQLAILAEPFGHP